MHDVHVAGDARTLELVRVVHRIGVHRVVRGRDVGVDLQVRVDCPDVARVRRIRRAILKLLRRVDDDVIVPARDEIEPRRALDHRLVLVQPEVAEDHDDIDVGPQQIDVELRRLDGIEGGNVK